MKENFEVKNIGLISFLGVFSYVIGIYMWIMIATVVIGWLISFNVISPMNHFILLVMELLSYATEPVLGRIRHFLPLIRGVDSSPYVVILVAWILKSCIERLILRILMGQKKRK